MSTTYAAKQQLRNALAALGTVERPSDEQVGQAYTATEEAIDLLTDEVIARQTSTYASSKEQPSTTTDRKEPS